MGSYCPHLSMFSRCLPLSSSARTVIFRSATNLKARTGADVDMNILASHGPRVNVTHIRRGGFQIDGHIVNGSVALFKGMFLKWNVKSMEEITEESLSLFRIFESKPRNSGHWHRRQFTACFTEHYEAPQTTRDTCGGPSLCKSMCHV